MNKSAVQKYAVWARKELIEQVKQRAYKYGINDRSYVEKEATVISGRVLTEDEIRQRRSFIERIKQAGYEETVEEVAYTWFNRFIALRYMEVNDYLPTHVRVLSDIKGNFKPEILKEVLHIELKGLDKKKVSEMLNNNNIEELYRYLLLTQCNALNDLLPEVFEKMGAYTEMLLPNNILKQDGVIGRLISDITPEKTWRDGVQIIGWLYQYYNSELKQAVYDGLKKNEKIVRKNIPAATQLFTPNWIVRYLVENSLGRLWMESHPNSQLKLNWKYYLDEAEQTKEVRKCLNQQRRKDAVKNPEEIKVIDCCMGSGHILVYAFDVLMQIYVSEGYTEREAARLILKKNIYGLEIDRRAYQLAYFALMMKARQYNRRILAQESRPQIYEPTGYSEGMEYGSLVAIGEFDLLTDQAELMREDCTDQTQSNELSFRRLLTQKYDIVITNPPYMGGKGMSAELSEYIRKHYYNGKNDLFSAFIERCGQLLKPKGYQAMITQHAWMFLSSYEELRKELLKRNIVNMAHLGARAFEEIGGQVVQTTAFVVSSTNVKGYTGLFIRLIDYGSQDEKEAGFLSGNHRYTASTDSFARIPGSPVAYWVGENGISNFGKAEALSKIANPRQGLISGDVNRFVRLWWECAFTKIGLRPDDVSAKWFPYNNGGEYRKWFGNNTDVVNWQNDGFEIQHFINEKGKQRSRPQNQIYYFREGGTWTAISSGAFSVRYYPEGSLFSNAGMAIFAEHEMLLYLIAMLNSRISQYYLRIFSETLNYNQGDIARIPVIIKDVARVNEIARETIELSRNDWNSFEISRDFVMHPIISSGGKTVEEGYTRWEHLASNRYNKVKRNEELLNRIFIAIYGLGEELEAEVEDSDVTVRRAELGRDIRSLMSYAVGCMFGRYSIDHEGLIYAGGAWNSEKYRTIPVEKDNILPLSDEEYFENDIAVRYFEFLEKVYGTDTLDENLKFTAKALGGVGNPREVIRNYFINEFYKDHVKMYKKRPIYWLFSSGKKNGFKALMYMHRYTCDLLAKLRTDYIHEQQERYRTQLTHIATVLNETRGVERIRMMRQRNKLADQAREISHFEERVHHLADKNIEIDTDDGVKENYKIFSSVLEKI